MNGIIKKYLPYAIVIFAVFLLVPLVFIKDGPLGKFAPVAFYFILLTTAVISAAIYCAKNGIDFLFTLMAPIAFLFTMIYSGGFIGTNLILLFVYLVAGIFGMFLGDLAFGDERRKKEKQEQEEQEKLMLRAKRRDERESRRMRREAAATASTEKAAPVKQKPAGQTTDIDADDFDYDKYMADIDRMLDEDKRYNATYFDD